MLVDIDVAAKIMNERDTQYGPAWLRTSQVVRFLTTSTPGTLNALVEAELLYGWIIILCKLIRAMRSPTDTDHWLDIENYAKLTRTELENRKAGKGG